MLKWIINLKITVYEAKTCITCHLLFNDVLDGFSIRLVWEIFNSKPRFTPILATRCGDCKPDESQ